MDRFREGGALAWRALGSLRLTIACLAGLMAVVLACTLAQARLGNYEAVRLFVRSPLVRWRGVPVFPGGGLLGGALLVNLVAAQVSRLEWSARKSGLWLCHLGLIGLFAGEFVSGLTRVEGLMVLGPGASKDYIESAHEAQLAVEGPGGVRAVLPETLWGRRPLADERLPFRAVVVSEDASRRGDDAPEAVCARVRLLGPDGRASGELAVSGDRAERVTASGRRYSLSIEPRRIPLGYSLKLDRFGRELYPASDIPKSFSSAVVLDDPGSRERRRTLISMNKPLRYRGKAFYQASFLPDGATSVLQVVDDPGWAVPYAACALVAAGLLLHFLMRLSQARGGAA